MSITDRNLEPGTKLVARYKGQEHVCVVEENPKGEGICYKLLGVGSPTFHKSLSAAGSAIMGGQACNGWRFWSLATDGKPEKKRPGRKAKAKANPTAFKRLEDGRAYCEACADAFEVGDDLEPATCPQGHAPAPTETIAPL